MSSFPTLQMQPLQELPNKDVLMTYKQGVVLQGFPNTKQKQEKDKLTRCIYRYHVEEIPPPADDSMNQHYLYAKFKHTSQPKIPSPKGISGGGVRRVYVLPDKKLDYEFVGINIGYNEKKGYLKMLKRESIVEFIKNNLK